MSKKIDRASQNEWTYRLDADEIGPGGRTLVLEPDARERFLIADRLKILSVDSLSAKMSLLRTQSGLVIRVTGTLKAQVSQTCVLTLDPVQDWIEEEFEACYADPEQAVLFVREKARRASGQVEEEGMSILSEFDDPEPLYNGQLDLADLVVQYLSLAINPYPKLERDDEGDTGTTGDEIPSGTRNPFESLKHWKKQG